MNEVYDFRLGKKMNWAFQPLSPQQGNERGLSLLLGEEDEPLGRRWMGIMIFTRKNYLRKGIQHVMLHSVRGAHLFAWLTTFIVTRLLYPLPFNFYLDEEFLQIRNFIQTIHKSWKGGVRATESPTMYRELYFCFCFL